MRVLISKVQSVSHSSLMIMGKILIRKPPPDELINMGLVRDTGVASLLFSNKCPLFQFNATGYSFFML